MRADADYLTNSKTRSIERVLQQIREVMALLQEKIDAEERHSGTHCPSDWRYPASALAMRARRENLLSTAAMLQAEQRDLQC
jgi:hypothetical protein